MRKRARQPTASARDTVDGRPVIGRPIDGSPGRCRAWRRPVVRGGVFRAVAVAAGFWPGSRSLAPLFSAIALVVSLVAAAAAFRAIAQYRQAARRHPAACPVDRRGAAGRGRQDRQGNRDDQRDERRGQPRDRKAVGADRRARRHRRAGAASRRNARQCRAASGGAASARRSRPSRSAAPAPDRSAIEAAYRKAVTAGEFDIALQPIVSVSRSAASGFEVFASLPVEGGARIDLRRLAQTLPGVESAAFERILVTTALSAGRRRLGAASAAMPLHVAISEAMLAAMPGVRAAPGHAAILSRPRQVDRAVDAERRLRARPARAGAGAVVGQRRPLRRRGLGRGGRRRHARSASRASTSSRSRPIACSTAKGSAASSSPAATIIESAAANDVTIIAIDVRQRRGCRQPASISAST